jgi:LmbE family N-acetylglucosaminyl deacetylase
MDGLEEVSAMIGMQFARLRRPLRVLCLGAHPDDIEIGCGGTLLEWQRRAARLSLTWVVLSSSAERAGEARRSAKALFPRAASLDLRIFGFTDGRFPAEWGELKGCFDTLKRELAPDVVFCPSLDDRHQDHRIVSELTWQSWRDAMILEYEVPKYEGDFGQPALHVPLARTTVNRKLDHLERCFPSQRSRPWFTRDTFQGLLRLRGIECRSASGHAEAFHVRKWTL